jgi:hypothetical protein
MRRHPNLYATPLPITQHFGVPGPAGDVHAVGNTLLQDKIMVGFEGLLRLTIPQSVAIYEKLLSRTKSSRNGLRKRQGISAVLSAWDWAQGTVMKRCPFLAAAVLVRRC